MTPPVYDAKIEALLRDLGNSDEAVATRAFWNAQSLTTEELLVLVEAEATLYAQNQRIAERSEKIGCVWGWATCAFIAMLIPAISLKFFPPLMWIPGLLALLLFRLVRFPDQKHLRKNIIRLIGEAHDKRFAGFALLMLNSVSNKDFRLPLEKALLQFLPQLRVADTAGWTIEHKRPLQHILTYWNDNRGLTLCLLKALEQIGDEWAVEHVQRLALMADIPEMDTYSAILNRGGTLRELCVQAKRNGLIKDFFGDDLETTKDFQHREEKRFVMDMRTVGQAAKECLPYLEARIEANRHSESLLRPADPATLSTPYTLLRPVQATGQEAKPEELLRPHQGTGL